jgi:transcriptional regulator with XRE-family HTH domain
VASLYDTESTSNRSAKAAVPGREYPTSSVERDVGSPGRLLKAARERIGLSTREVERFTLNISRAILRPECAVSSAWISRIENGSVTPSIYKLYSLAAVYGVSVARLFSAYGLDLDNAVRMGLSLHPPRTSLVATTFYDPASMVPLPTSAEHGVRLESTNLLSAMLRDWRDVPIVAIAEIIAQKGMRSVCGYIGSEDFTMWPLLRPGSFVIVDNSQRKVRSQEWRTEYHRPIYFLETRDEYACGWAELRGDLLMLVPHPMSGCPTRVWAYPAEVEVVGRVTAVATRLVDLHRRPRQADRQRATGAPKGSSEAPSQR